MIVITTRAKYDEEIEKAYRKGKQEESVKSSEEVRRLYKEFKTERREAILND